MATNSKSVFEGKIVVTGGYSHNGLCKLVESFDHQEKKWLVLPGMIERRLFNSSVTIGNKLVVVCGIDRSTSEIYDSISIKFTMFSLKILYDPYSNTFCKALSINNKILLFCWSCSTNDSSKIYVYNVEVQKLNRKEFNLEYNLSAASFQKTPKH